MRPSTSTSLTRTERWSLLALSAVCLSILFQTVYVSSHGGAPLVASLALSGLAYALTYALIRWLGETFMKRGLKGRDMGKVGKNEIPETMGAVCAVVYLLAIIVFIPFPFYKDIVSATSGGGNRDMVVEVKHVSTGRFLHKFPHSKLASYLSAILSLQSVVLLGVGDDLFDIRWRHKILIPAFASIPMLIVYFVDFGVTKIVVPTVLRPYLGELVDLGWMYYAYMASISIFCPNSINILAGINGIEVAQSIIIALLILLNDALYLLPNPFSSTKHSTTPNPATDPHLFSIYLLVPFLATSLALLQANWFPARVFVGDTYCYFAGMVFAVVAIQAHFSKTLLVLLLPQMFNFAYSAPQLFGLVPCPRHRLPHFNARTGLREPSWADLAPPALGGGGAGADGAGSHARAHSHADAHESNKANGSAGASAVAVVSSTAPAQTRATSSRAFSAPVQASLKLLAALKLLRIETQPASPAPSGSSGSDSDEQGAGTGPGPGPGSRQGKASSGQGQAQAAVVTRCTNMTLLNLWLVWFGPMREDRLALGVLALQAALGAAGLVARHALARVVFGFDNL